MTKAFRAAARHVLRRDNGGGEQNPWKKLHSKLKQLLYGPLNVGEAQKVQTKEEPKFESANAENKEELKTEEPEEVESKTASENGDQKDEKPKTEQEEEKVEPKPNSETAEQKEEPKPNSEAAEQKEEEKEEPEPNSETAEQKTEAEEEKEEPKANSENEKQTVETAEQKTEAEEEKEEPKANSENENQTVQITIKDLLSIASDIMVVQATAETSLKVIGSLILAANKGSGEAAVALSKTLAGLDAQQTSDNVKQILSKVIDIDGTVKDIDAKLDGKVPPSALQPRAEPSGDDSGDVDDNEDSPLPGDDGPMEDLF
ncbi:hypothetical protein RHSIM_Rhsim04G0212700 [Rhododendron simsii]|uniref:Uncharacterized protein n=1 Tax=Rhododendron simsii TaxID=118357 RepID=A0A834H6T9_RHOSS|nr:hypothetical protein RHSIM_Rhsim04G0212700 [Rhododendron simsii]